MGSGSWEEEEEVVVLGPIVWRWEGIEAAEERRHKVAVMVGPSRAGGAISRKLEGN